MSKGNGPGPGTCLRGMFQFLRRASPPCLPVPGVGSVRSFPGAVATENLLSLHLELGMSPNIAEIRCYCSLLSRSAIYGEYKQSIITTKS